MRVDMAWMFVALLAIGIVAGVIFDRVAGPGWLSRQIAGAARTTVTSMLIGIAGSFIGFHLATIFGFNELSLFFGAAIGAAAILFGWRMVH